MSRRLIKTWPWTLATAIHELPTTSFITLFVTAKYIASAIGINVARTFLWPTRTLWSYSRRLPFRRISPFYGFYLHSMESAVKPVCSQTSLDDACSFVLHSNSSICRPHRPQAEKPEKQIYKSNFPAQFSCTLCSIPFQNCGSLMTDCTAYHDVFRTIPVSLLTLKWGAKTPPIVINMWHKYVN